MLPFVGRVDRAALFVEQFSRIELVAYADFKKVALVVHAIFRGAHHCLRQSFAAVSTSISAEKIAPCKIKIPVADILIYGKGSVGPSADFLCHTPH